MQSPKIPVAEIEKQLSALSRGPFQASLARILACEPDEKSISKAARKFPDRWAQIISIFGRLAGYTEKLEVSADVSLRPIKDLSDSQLTARILEVERHIGTILEHNPALNYPLSPQITDLKKLGAPITPEKEKESIKCDR